MLEDITGPRICNSILNHSKSKMMYSFCKSARFPKNQMNSSVDVMYNLPSVQSKRKTTFGFGKKSDFCKKDNHSSSSSNLFSDFDQTRPHAFRYTFGIGRENLYEYKYKRKENIVPGPGKYDVGKKFGDDGIKYSFKGANDENKSKGKKCKNKNDFVMPGPGQYETICVNQYGRYVNSKFMNIPTIKFGSKNAKRFIYKIKQGPSPASYEKLPLFGRVIDSRYKSSNGISFAKKYKKKKENDSPGPGAYSFFSEFGIYNKEYINKL